MAMNLNSPTQLVEGAMQIVSEIRLPLKVSNP
jgi:hypothetical protein